MAYVYNMQLGPKIFNTNILLNTTNLVLSFHTNLLEFIKKDDVVQMTIENKSFMNGNEPLNPFVPRCQLNHHLLDENKYNFS